MHGEKGQTKGFLLILLCASPQSWAVFLGARQSAGSPRSSHGAWTPIESPACCCGRVTMHLVI